MKILITGGKGQLGTEIGQLLRLAGIPYDAPGKGELDVTDCRALEAAIDGKADAQPATAVIHTAALTEVDNCETNGELAFAVNAAATKQLARLCAERRIPLVYISTDYVFDGTKNAHYEVDDPPAPLNVYGASKLAGEEAVLRLTEYYYIVRTSWLFGVHGRNFPRTILQLAASGKPLRVVDDQVGAPTYARDLAEAVLTLLGIIRPLEGIQVDQPVVASTIHGMYHAMSTTRTRSISFANTPARYGIYHITNSGNCSWFAFAREILDQAGWQLDVKPIGTIELNRPARRPAYSVLSLANITSLGLYPRPWQEALSSFLPNLRSIAPELFPGKEE